MKFKNFIANVLWLHSKDCLEAEKKAQFIDIQLKAKIY